jgi:hypothetical protein
MKNQISDDHGRNRIPWNFIGQIVLALIIFYILGRVINSLSFTGMNGIEITATEEVSAQEIFDDFSYKVFDVKWNESTWAEVGAESHMSQLDGVMILSRKVGGFGGLVAHRRKWLLSQINHVSSRLMLNSAIQTQAGEVGFQISTVGDENQWFARCGIHGGRNETTALIHCDTADKFSTTPVAVAYDTWHVIKIEVDAENPTLTFFVDGAEVGKYIPQETNDLKSAEYSLMLEGSSSDDGSLTGSFDYVQLKNR